jgi:hypothetical protein
VKKGNNNSVKSGKQMGNQTGGIVKTVILPYDEINNLKAECEYLK